MAQSLDELSTPSEGQLRLMEDFSYALIILGTIICGMVLVAYATVAYQGTEFRKHLDRVSFRLLVEALVSYVIYGIALTLSHLAGRQELGCGLGSFATNITFLLGIFFTTCIAINSQFVLVHEFNGKALEKYYVITVVVLAFIPSSAAYGSGQLGWNDDIDWCWYNNPDRSRRFRWVIATQSIWVALAAAIEIASSFCVLLWLYRSKSTIFSLFRRAPKMNNDGEIQTSSPYTSTTVMLARDPKYRRIIIRIALYPIVSMLLNILGLSLDLHLSVAEVDSQLQFRLLVLDMILLGSRNIIYGMLAFSDPSFVNAVRDLSGEQSAQSTRGFNALASRLLNEAASALKFKQTLTSSTLSEATSTVHSTPSLNGNEESLSSGNPLESEREDFQRLKTQL